MAEAMGGNVFKDLEIDNSAWVEDADAAIEFKENVFAAAKKLGEILDSDASSSSVEQEARNEYKGNPELRKQYREQFAPLFEGIYNAAEDVPLPIIVGMIDGLYELIDDLKNTMKERARFQAVHMTESLNDKKLAQIQHKRLREAWEVYRRFAKLIFELEFPAIKARPGNFAASISDTYNFKIVGEDNDGYFNHFAVAKILGIHYNGIKFMDIMEYCEANPDKVIVTKVRL